MFAFGMGFLVGCCICGFIWIMSKAQDPKKQPDLVNQWSGL